MIALKDVADYILSLGIVDANHIWIGRMTDKVDESIGVYPLKTSSQPIVPIGGSKNTDYESRRISLLVHWNKSVIDTEQVAYMIYETLEASRNVHINQKKLLFNQMLGEPVNVSTDGYGIYEYVIELESYFKKEA